MRGDAMQIKATQTPDLKNYFSPPLLSRSDADDQALRSRLEEMGVDYGSYAGTASRATKNVEALPAELRFIVLGGIDNAGPAAAMFSSFARKLSSRFL